MKPKPTDWVTFCKRTEDPKLAHIEHLLDVAGIPSRRNGYSWHAPILEVQAKNERAADAILRPIDDIDDDDPQFEDGVGERDNWRADQDTDEETWWDERTIRSWRP